jgi:hypothetical protein
MLAQRGVNTGRKRFLWREWLGATLSFRKGVMALALRMPNGHRRTLIVRAEVLLPRLTFSGGGSV